jgi:uncharacterized protein (DUF433 family)
MGVVSLAKHPAGPAAGGFYTVREAARLLNISNAAVISGWVKGRSGRGSGPVIVRQYQPIGRVQELSFLDLIEVRFIEHFRKQGYSLQSLRKAAETARAELDCEHPFALYGVKFVAERKNIFLKVARDIGDAKGRVTCWRPREKEFPGIIVDPTVAYGQPALEANRVPTDAIFSTWKAEGGDYAAVADWFEIEKKQAQEAVEFELALPN